MIPHGQNAPPGEDAGPVLDATAERTGEAVDLFISHSSEDAIAQELFALIRDEVYGGDRAAANRHVFFSGDKEAGLLTGDDFDRMLQTLKAARRVVALVTLRSSASVAVLTEMALANAQKTLLPVVARKEYRALLKWPFDHLQAAALDSADEIRQLMAQLATIARRPRSASDAERYEELAATVRQTHPLPPRPGWGWRIATGVLLLLLVPLALAAYSLGSNSAGPRTEAVGATEKTTGDTSIQIVHQSTFPRKRLSSRLHEIRASLGSGVAEVHELFARAIRETNHAWGLNDTDLQELENVVKRWEGGDSKLEFAGGLPCDQLPVALDQQWCRTVDTLLGSKAARFDDTKFAIARVGPSRQRPPRPAVILVSDRPVPGTTWIVRDINAVTLQVAN